MNQGLDLKFFCDYCGEGLKAISVEIRNSDVKVYLQPCDCGGELCEQEEENYE